MIDLSVVIPIRNEAPSLVELHRELTETLGGVRTLVRNHHRGRRQHGRGVRDPGAAAGRRPASARDPAPPQLRTDRGVRRRLRTTRAGALIVTSDGDLQNDPHDIPAMVAMLEGGFDIVCGWRKDRKDAFVSRRLPSMIANALISVGHRRAPARLRLLAEGVPRRDREGDAALRRDAPVPAGHRERADVEHRRDGGQPSCAQVRASRSTASAVRSA